jgi:endonuclease-3 related protein
VLALRPMSATAFHPDRAALLAIYENLLTAYGDQQWWPGDTPFEIMVGAVLTQNTAWSNVEKAIANLKAAAALSPQVMLALPDAELAELIRPSGYFNVKAHRLKNFCRFLLDAGGEAALARLPTAELRTAVLGVNGVGPETCDDILLYAFERPVFVIDTYTRRLLQRYGLATGKESYEALRQGFETSLGPDVALYQQYHALVVEHAKVSCATKPRCPACCLETVCEGRS